MTLRKRLKSLALSALSALSLASSPVLAAGTVPLALSVQTDSAGNIAAGCILNFYVAGTVATPQNSYSDFGLSQNPLAQVSCDQSGRLPMFWLADGLIHIRLTDSGGVPIVDTTMQVLGPSSGGGGGGGTVDPTTILATGDLKFRYATGALTGFVRLNGLTIGSATSGATERANQDAQNLFVFLYTVDPNLAVSGGRTGNALNDFNANKRLTLPDWRGRVPGGLDDMGNTAAGRLTTSFGANATVLGSAGNSLETVTLATANLPPYTPSITQQPAFSFMWGASPHGTGGTPAVDNLLPSGIPGGTTLAPIRTQDVVIAAQGGSDQPFAVVQPTMLATFYIKL